MPTEPTTTTPGALVRARPYVQQPDGHGGSRPVQLGFRKALVLGQFGDYPVAWFLSLGAPHQDCAVQPLYPSMERKPTGETLQALDPRLLRRLDRLIGRAEGSMFGGDPWRLLHERRMEIQTALRAAAQSDAP